MLIDFVFSLPALFFILFVPGYALISALFPKKPLEWPEKILTAVLFSITLNILSTLALNLILNIPFQLSALLIQNAVFIIIFSATYFIRLRRIPRFYLELHEYNLERFLKTPAVIILILSTVLLAYSVHLSYQFPFLPVEWAQITEAKKIIDSNQITGSGFHIFLAQIYLLTGQIPAYYSIYLPAIFSGIAALGIYAFTKKTTENTHIALLSVLFFAGVKSNTPLLGTWFLTPVILAASFIFTILYFILSGFEEKNKTKILIASFLMLGLASIEPISAAFAAIVFLIYLIIRRKEAKDNLLEIGVFYLITLFALLPALTLIEGTTQTPKIISAPQYLILYYGIIPFVLALIGAVYCIKKNKSFSLILYWTGLVIALIILFQITGLKILTSYAETLYLSLLILATLSACGLYAIVEVLNSKIKINLVAAIISILIIAASAYVIFPDYYDGTKSLGKPMEDRTYDAIKWLARTKGNESLVLSRPEIAPIIPAIVGSNLTTLNTGASKDVYEYFMSDCPGKKEVIKKYNVTFILVSVEDKIDCEFLPWIYIQKGIYIYEVDKTLL